MIFNSMRDQIKKCLMEYQEQQETDIFSVIEKDVAHFLVEMKLKYNLESVYQSADIASQIMEKSGWVSHVDSIRNKSLLDLGDGQLNEDNEN